MRDRGPRGRQGAGLDRAARDSRHAGPLLASTHAKRAHPLASAGGFGPARSNDSAFSLQFLGRSGCACRIPERGAPRLVARPHHPAAGSACFLPQPVEVRVVGRRLSGVLCPTEALAHELSSPGLAEPADPCRSQRDRPVAIPPGHAGDARSSHAAGWGFPRTLEVLLHFGWNWRIKGGQLFIEAVSRLVEGGGRRVLALGQGEGDRALEVARQLGCRTTFARLAPSRASPASSRRRMYSWP